VCSSDLGEGRIAALAPTRRSEVAQLSMKGLVAGTLASLVTAAIAGIVL
jgi:CNT family concentrative nucleoside transporter